MAIAGQGRRLAPGIALCAAVTVLAVSVQRGEEALVGHPYVEALVLAILLGTAIRTVWAPGPAWTPGIAFSARTLLEIAVMLLGASISLGLIAAAGAALLGGIAATVAVVIAASYGLGRLLRLPHRMAILIACGNAICGNSAIAAVAPVIGADGDEIASSIAFTAILGVIVVLALPLLIPLLRLSETQYGVIAGLTVYAVPQVLAATLPVGTVSAQVGTVVKLVRVLMLGPVVLGAALLAPRLGARPAGARPAGQPARRPGLRHLVPWFILGFLVLAALRSLGLVPEALLAPAASVSRVLTVISMAALGLGVDVRVLGQVGPAVTLAVTLSLLVLVAVSIALVKGLGLA